MGGEGAEPRVTARCFPFGLLEVARLVALEELRGRLAGIAQEEEDSAVVESADEDA